MRGDLRGAEARTVVRHLLSGCGECKAVTGSVWGLGDQPFPVEVGIADEVGAR